MKHLHLFSKIKFRIFDQFITTLKSLSDFLLNDDFFSINIPDVSEDTDDDFFNDFDINTNIEIKPL